MEITPHSELVENHGSRILENVGLSWKDLDNKKVLDVGSADARLARAGKGLNSSAIIFSVDIDDDNWVSLPSDIKNNCFTASADNLPFPIETFDLIINSGSIMPHEIKDEIRVLKSGGEIRVSPIGGLLLEYRYIGQFLYEHKNWSEEKINTTLDEFHKRIIENEEGFIPKDYVDLRTTALKTLTQEEKKETIESLVEQYSDMVGVQLSYKIKNPQDLEPEGYVFYKKP